MDKLAYDNLKLLDETYSDSLFLINDNNILSLIEKDSFDTCSILDSLEYPIYFTYHQVLNIIDYENDISYKKKQELVDMIENSLDNLIDYLDDYKAESKYLSSIINDIYERKEIVKKNNKYNYFENFIYLFDELVDSCRTAKKYLYFSPRPYNILYDMKPGDLYEPVDELCFDSSDSDNYDNYDSSDGKDDDDDDAGDDGDDGDDDDAGDDDDGDDGDDGVDGDDGDDGDDDDISSSDETGIILSKDDKID